MTLTMPTTALQFSTVSTDAPKPDGGLFPDTPWTQLQQLRGTDTLASRALGNVCQLYWFPVYAYIRSQGKSPHDAEDLTQGFFQQLLKRDDLSGLAREDGRLRAFLLTAIKNYLRDSWRRDRAKKRGGDREVVSLDLETAERRFAEEQADNLSPERAFEQQWAVTLLDNVVTELGEEYARAGKGTTFEALRGVLAAGQQDPDYGEVAGQLGIGREAARVAAHRLRKRYGQLLMKHIAATLDDGDCAETELAYLMSVFSKHA